MKYKEALLIISTALLSACGSKDSDTTDVSDFSYNVTLDVVSDQKNSTSDIGLSQSVDLYSKDGARIKLNNGDQFNITLNNQVHRGENFVKSLPTETVCCVVEGEPSTMIKTDEEHILQAEFVRNNEVTDSFELSIPQVPNFIDIADTTFVYNLNEGQDIKIEWEAQSENFSDISFEDPSFCIDIETNFFNLEPNQTSVTLPVKNKDICGVEEFSVTILGAVTSSGTKETELTNAPVSFLITHEKKVEFKVKFN